MPISRAFRGFALPLQSYRLIVDEFFWVLSARRRGAELVRERERLMKGADTSTINGSAYRERLEGDRYLSRNGFWDTAYERSRSPFIWSLPTGRRKRKESLGVHQYTFFGACFNRRSGHLEGFLGGVRQRDFWGRDSSVGSPLRLSSSWGGVIVTQFWNK